MTDIKKDIIQKINISDSNVGKYTDRFNRFYKLYRNYIDEGKWSTRSKIFTPLVFSVIESQVSRNIASTPAGEWKPATDNKVGDADKLTATFKEWWKKERMVLTTQDTFKKTLLYGSAAAQVYWKYETGTKQGKSYVKHNGPAVRILRLEDKMFGFDPEATSFDNAKWAFIRYPITKKELEDIKKSPSADKYQNIDEAIQDFIDLGYKQEGLLNEKLNVIDSSTTKDTTVKKAECIYLENYETGERITMVGRKHIIFQQKNPFLAERTLLMTSNIRVPGEIIGMSEVEPIEKLQHGVNLFRNQRADVIDSMLNPRWIVGNGAEVEDNEILEEDSMVVHAEDIAQVKTLDHAGNASVAFKEDESIKNDIYAATSVTPFSMGNDNDVKSDRSGKAIAHLQSAADARIKSKLTNFEVDFIKNVAEIWQRLMAQFQTEDILLEDEEMKVTPKDLGATEGEWEYWVESGSTQHVSDVANREDYLAFQEKLLELSALKAQGGSVNYDKLAEKLSEVFGIKEWRDLWEGVEQPMPEEQLPEGQGMPQEAPQGELPQGGELLPPVEQEAQQAVPQEQPAQAQEQPQELPQGEMLPAVEEPQKKAGLFNKLKQFLKK